MPTLPPVRLAFGPMRMAPPRNGRQREREVAEVAEDEPDDLAEAERHDREVVAAQLQGRRAEQDAEEGGGRDRDPDDDPPADVDAEVADARNAVV